MTESTITASVAGAMTDHRGRQPGQDQQESRPIGRGDMSGMDYGMRVLSYLIAGVLFYGGLGWLGDHYLGTQFLLPVGIVLGAAGGCYIIIRRYGQHPEEPIGVAGRRYSRAGRRAANPWQSNRKEGVQ